MKLLRFLVLSQYGLAGKYVIIILQISIYDWTKIALLVIRQGYNRNLIQFAF